MSLFLLLPGEIHGRRICAHIDEVYDTKEELDKMKMVYVQTYYQSHGIITTPVYVPEAMNEILTKMLFGSLIVGMDINTARQTLLPGTTVLENNEIPERIEQSLYALYCARLDVSKFVQTLNEPEFSMVAQLLVKRYTAVIDNIIETIAKQSLTVSMDDVDLTEQQLIDIDLVSADHDHFYHQHEQLLAKTIKEREEAALAQVKANVEQTQVEDETSVEATT
jgi:hypothetical protein